MWFADLFFFKAEDMRRLKVKGAFLVVCEALSHQIWARALPDKRAETIIAALKDIFDKEGRKPQVLITDAGGEFVSAKTQKACPEL